MKNILKLAALCAIVPTLLQSCSKNNNDSTQGPYSSLDDIYSGQSLQAKSVTISAGTDTTFYGNSGTRYVYTGNSLQTAGGTTVTGQVQIQVCEYLQMGDMVFSKMLPLSNGQSLLSNGELSISATQNGQRLYLAHGSYFAAYIPQSGGIVPGVDLFKCDSSTTNPTSLSTWIAARKDSGSAIGVIIAPGDTLLLITDSLKLCNADAFMTAPSYQTFTVTVTANGAAVPANATVAAYALYDTYKGIWPLGASNNRNASGAFQEEHVPNIPVHFAVFTIINGSFYGGVTGATPTTGSSYTVNLDKMDPEAFKAQLNAL